MALGATVYKASLQVSDLDRHHYDTHALVLAQHPSETAERVMVRLLAFALHADERLEFGRGISTDDEPDLWRRDRTGVIEQWIDVGQPDESRVRKACGRAREVVVIAFGGRAVPAWWEKSAATFERLRNLTVLEVDAAAAKALGARLARGMDLQAVIQDGHVQLIDGETTIDVAPVRLR